MTPSGIEPATFRLVAQCPTFNISTKKNHMVSNLANKAAEIPTCYSVTPNTLYITHRIFIGNSNMTVQTVSENV